MAALFSAQDYTAAFLGLRPQGRVWPQDALSVQASLFGRLAPTYERSDARAIDLLVDAFPATAIGLLGEWEAALGLPDPCVGAVPTLQQRQHQVVARLAGSGGQSRAFFIAYAQALGYAITIKTFAPFRAGRSRAGDRCYGPAWSHAWQVEGVANPVTSYFRAGRSVAGEPLRTFGVTVLECEFEELKPAHTHVLFAYS